MLLIKYIQVGNIAGAEMKGASTDTLDMIIALYCIARACKLTKAQASALIDAWDDLTEIFNVPNYLVEK